MKLSETLSRLKDAVPPSRTEEIDECIKMSKAYEEINKELELDAVKQSTAIYAHNDGIMTMWLTACCKTGPIVNENYCPGCGKKIIKYD